MEFNTNNDGANSFDFSELALKETTTYHIRHPGTDEPLYTKDAEGKAIPITAELYGPGSDTYRKASFASTNRLIAANKKKMTAELGSESTESVLWACVKSFSSNAVFAGVVPGSDKAKIKEILANGEYVWLKNQLDAFMGDTANFLKKPN